MSVLLTLLALLFADIEFSYAYKSALYNFEVQNEVQK